MEKSLFGVTTSIRPFRLACEAVCLVACLFLPVLRAEDQVHSNSLGVFSPPSEYGQLQNVTFTATAVIEAQRAFANVSADTIFTTKAKYVLSNQFESGASVPNHYYEITQLSGSSKDLDSIKQVRGYSVAWDGKTLQRLIWPDQRLTLTSKEVEYDGPAYDDNALLLPFRFISLDQSKVFGEIMNLSLPSSVSAWKAVRDLLASGSYTLSQDGNIVSIKTSLYNFSQKATVSYAVDFDKSKGFYPTHWTMSGPDGSTIQEYRINKFGTVRTPNTKITIPYPEVATMIYYVDKQIATKDTITITGIQLNAPLDPDLFTIDPSKANLIWDDDKRVQIIVPR